VVDDIFFFFFFFFFFFLGSVSFGLCGEFLDSFCFLCVSSF